MDHNQPFTSQSSSEPPPTIWRFRLAGYTDDDNYVHPPGPWMDTTRESLVEELLERGGWEVVSYIYEGPVEL